MATQKLGAAPPPEHLTDYLRTRLCSEHAALDAERLKLQEAARNKAKRQAEIEQLLTAQLELDGATVCDLNRWQFGVELRAGSLYYKAELLKEIGEEELRRRQEAQPPKRDFFLRDKGPARPAAKSARLKKNAGKKPGGQAA